MDKGTSGFHSIKNVVTAKIPKYYFSRGAETDF